MNPRILLLLFAAIGIARFVSASSFEPTTSTLAIAPEPGKWQWFWINRVEEFRTENATLDPEQRYVVFLGDSLTQGFDLDRYFPGAPVLNRGIGSDGVADFPGGTNIWRGITRRMKESVFDCHPSHVFLLIGTNDVGPPTIPMEYWFGNYVYVVERIEEAFPDVRIVVVTCPPTGIPYARRERLNRRVLEWNAILRDYARERGFRLIDLHAMLVGEDGLLPQELSRDGLHFNQIGYERYAGKVREILREDGLIPPE